MYIRTINNLETTTASAITANVTTSITAVLDTSIAAQNAIYSAVDATREEVVWLTITDGTNTDVVQVVDAASINSTSGTLTFATAPTHSYASGVDIALRIPAEVLSAFVQQHVGDVPVTPTLVPHGTVGYKKVAADTTFVIGTKTAGEYVRLFLLDTGTLDNSLTPVLTFEPEHPLGARIVWPNDTAPTFGAGAGLLDVTFFYSPLGVDPAVGDPEEIIFGTWTKSTSGYGV